VEAGFNSRGWRIVMRVSVAAKLPLDDNGCSDQEIKNNRHRDWKYQPLSRAVMPTADALFVAMSREIPKSERKGQRSCRI
jgi:hypothetical protein